jgi:hypothetical protein
MASRTPWAAKSRPMPTGFQDSLDSKIPKVSDHALWSRDSERSQVPVESMESPYFVYVIVYSSTSRISPSLLRDTTR